MASQVRYGPDLFGSSAARWAEPLNKLIYNYPTDTSRLKQYDLVVRDVLKLAREVEGNRMPLEAAKTAFARLPADNQAVHCLHGAALDLKDSYTDALAVTELTLHGAKRFADLSQRLMTAMLAGLISRAISAEYAMQFQERIANIIHPFATLFERTHAAYQDAFE
jgi:hypothetical protein